MKKITAAQFLKELQNRERKERQKTKTINARELYQMRKQVDKAFFVACEKLEKKGSPFNFFDPQVRRSFEQSRNQLLIAFLRTTGKVLAL